MEFTTCYCPHPQCTHYGQRGFGTHLVRCGADRGIPRLLCTMCQGTFSVRQGTAYFGIRVEEPNYTIAMRALAEGNSLRGTGRIVDVDKDTVCDWVDRVAYLSPADNVSRPLPYRLRRLNQPVMSPPNWFSIPRSTLLSSICAHASRSIARSSTGILF